MKNELEWSKNLLEKHPKTKEALEKWVHKQLQDVQNEMAKEAGVTEFPVVDEQKAKDYVPYSLAGNPDYYLQFFDENQMYASIFWDRGKNSFCVLTSGTEYLEHINDLRKKRQEATLKAIEILFEEYERTKV